MSDIWVCKGDGLIQCDEDSKEITLKEMRKELGSIIGDNNILDAVKRFVLVPAACGFPSGGINAYKITPEGYMILQRGIVGPLGFSECDNTQDSPVEKDKIPLGLGISNISKHQHIFIRELPGHPSRVYNIGDALTQDFNPERFNIGRDENGIIKDAWFG